MKEKEYISIVLYVFNKEEFIEISLDRILNFLISNFENFEIIIVNDASDDKTNDIVENFVIINEEYNITVINLAYKHGLEVGISVGVDFSVGDFVIELDSPIIPFDVNIFKDLYNKCCEGFDIVSLTPENFIDFNSKFFYFILNSFSKGKNNYKSELGYIITRRALNEISRVKDKIKYRKILHNFSGFRKSYLNVTLNHNIDRSTIFLEKINIATEIVFSFTSFGFKINIFLTFFFLFISLTMGFYSVYQYVFNEKIVTGWTTVMLFISSGFTGVFLVLSIISMFMSILLKEIRTMPRFTIESIQKK